MHCIQFTTEVPTRLHVCSHERIRTTRRGIHGQKSPAACWDFLWDAYFSFKKTGSKSWVSALEIKLRIIWALSDLKFTNHSLLRYLWQRHLIILSENPMLIYSLSVTQFSGSHEHQSCSFILFSLHFLLQNPSYLSHAASSTEWDCISQWVCWNSIRQFKSGVAYQQRWAIPVIVDSGSDSYSRHLCNANSDYTHVHYWYLITDAFEKANISAQLIHQ